jgi:hypothetical protein
MVLMCNSRLPSSTPLIDWMELTIKFNITCCSCTRSHWMRGNSPANINDAMRPVRVELAELRISNCELRAANAELRDQAMAGRITECACAAVTRQPREQMRAPRLLLIRGCGQHNKRPS